MVMNRVTTPIAPAGLTWVPGNMMANLSTTPAPGSLIPAGYYQNICMPLNPSLVVDPAYPVRPAFPPAAGTIVRQVYLNEKVDGVTATPLGMQLNGVPFEYKVTETPKNGTAEVWQFVNLTVDAHPMHPHLVAHKILARQNFNVGQYKKALCGSTTCQPGPAPGNEMQVVPDVTPFLTGQPTPVTDASVEGGPKDATQAPPGLVTTIQASWGGRWLGANAGPLAPGNAPGTAGCPNGTLGCQAPYTYESVTSGPYVWHCHINSHEDSEMMRTSLVVP
jgi:FtsP/CotA-like multicopper oxidase with cupredoxin domain